MRFTARQVTALTVAAAMLLLALTHLVAFKVGMDYTDTRAMFAAMDTLVTRSARLQREVDDAACSLAADTSASCTETKKAPRQARRPSGGSVHLPP